MTSGASIEALLRVGFALAVLALAGCPAAPAGRQPPNDVTSRTAVREPADGSASPAEAGQPVRANPTPSAPATPPATFTATPSASPTQSADPRPPVRIAFVGDVHGQPPIAGVLAGGDNPLEDVAALLADADMTVANLETAVGSSGAPADKDFTFQAAPALVDALAAAGVDVVSVANNHALDFGRDALAETSALASAAGLQVIGAGPDSAHAYAPAVIDIGGRRVAFLGLTRVLPEAHWAAGPSSPGMASAYDIATAAAAVRAAAEHADHVLVTVHWGQERNPCPVDHQLELTTALIEAGAQVIAGHHPHVLQGVEQRGGALIAYSLGNFLFYAGPGEGRTTGVLTVTLDDAGVSDWVFSPAQVDDRGSPVPLAGAEADRVLETLAERSPGGACRFD